VPEPKQHDPVSEWMLEVTTLLERVNARLLAVEKSMDQNTAAVATAASASAAAATALTRIAKTDEDRLTFDKLAEERRVQERTEDRNHRDAWFSRVWSSNAVQLLLLGLVIAVLNLLGISYIADRMLPFAGGSSPSHQEGSSPVGEGGQ